MTTTKVSNQMLAAMVNQWFQTALAFSLTFLAMDILHRSGVF
jgi:hypothetical protein